MAVAHARPRERAEILRELIARGDEDESVRARTHLLAMACLEHATELDPGVRGLVEERAAAFVPPQDDEAARALAEVGPMVLELLPGPEGLSDQVARAVVVTASRISTDAAIPVLRRFRSHQSLEVRAQLAWAWHRFDARPYFDEVICHLNTAGLRLVAHERDHLELLQGVADRSMMQVHGDFSADELSASLDLGRLTDLVLANNAQLSDLEFLRECRRLTELVLLDCHGIASLEPLTGTPLTYLQYTQSTLRPLPVGLDKLTTLGHLLLYVPSFEQIAGVALPELPSLDLTTFIGASNTDLSWIPRSFPRLSRLGLYSDGGDAHIDLAPLAAMPQLRAVDIDGYDGVAGADQLAGVDVSVLQ
jgi:hypothetical protein